jgi:hypothetical protein
MGPPRWHSPHRVGSRILRHQRRGGGRWTQRNEEAGSRGPGPGSTHRRSRLSHCPEQVRREPKGSPDPRDRDIECSMRTFAVFFCVMDCLHGNQSGCRAIGRHGRRNFHRHWRQRLERRICIGYFVRAMISRSRRRRAWLRRFSWEPSPRVMEAPPITPHSEEDQKLRTK